MKKTTSKNRKWIYIGGGIVVVLAIVIALSNKGPKQERVTTEKVHKESIVETVTANGNIHPEVEVKLSPDVAGEITDLYVKEGDSVQKGQLLLRINPEIFASNMDRARATVENAKANLATSEARLEQSRSRISEVKPNYERNKKLHDQKVISDSEFETIRATYESAMADVKAAEKTVEASRYTVKSLEASVKEANENLKRTNIYAPMNGIVSKLNVEKGERVVGTSQMAGTELMRISDLSSMEMRVDVSENDIIRISVGDTADIEIDAYGTRKFKGIVKEVANSSSNIGTTSSADQVTNFQVKIRVLNDSYQDLLAKNPGKPSPFLPGMSGMVEIQTDKVYNTLVIPIEAVTTRKPETAKTPEKDEKENAPQVEKEGDKTGENTKTEKNNEIVFKFVNGKAEQVTVKTGVQDSKYIQVLEGLKEGDEIITGPYRIVSRTLKTGDAVTVVEKDKVFKKD